MTTSHPFRDDNFVEVAAVFVGVSVVAVPSWRSDRPIASMSIPINASLERYRRHIGLELVTGVKMQALTLHRDKRPTLARGTVFLPLSSWKITTPLLRVLRAVERRDPSGKRNYFTLVKLPEDQLVALIKGIPKYSLQELEFHRLNDLPEEDADVLREWLSQELDVPDLSATSIDFVVRLVLGESLPRSCLKWTKDIRLLEQGKRKASTKRY